MIFKFLFEKIKLKNNVYNTLTPKVKVTIILKWKNKSENKWVNYIRVTNFYTQLLFLLSLRYLLIYLKYNGGLIYLK